MKLAVVGATGLVGQEVLKVIDERNIEFDELYLIASAKSVGQKIKFKGKEYTIKSIEEGCELAADVAIFSAGGGTSPARSPKFTTVPSFRNATLNPRPAAMATTPVKFVG